LDIPDTENMSDDLTPEKKTVLSNLASRVRQIGRDLLNPERAAVKRSIGRRAELIELRDKLFAERARVADKIEAGELTQLAFDRIDRQFVESTRQLGLIDTSLPLELLNTCENPDLRHEYHKLLRGRGAASKRETELIEQARVTRELLGQAQAAVERVAKTLAENKHKPQAIAEHAAAQRAVESLTRELGDVVEDLAQVTSQRKSLADELSAVKIKMRDS
jgi:hypothetical protein